MEKAKSRFTSLDVRAVTQELAGSLVGCHLQNIYDINQRTFLLKFTKKDKKVLLLLESGVRIHATRLDRENPNTTPSQFALRLRRCLRERRLTRFEQLGFDRIVHFEFGHDSRPELAMHLYLEMYSIGNVILTDHEQRVICLVREVKGVDKESGCQVKLLTMGSTFSMDEGLQQLPDFDSATAATFQKSMETSRETMRNYVRTRLPSFSPQMVSACLEGAGIAPTMVACDCSASPVLPSRLLEAIRTTIATVRGDGKVRLGGGVLALSRTGPSEGGPLSFIDFAPLLPTTKDEGQSPKDGQAATVSFATFNEAVDEYFYKRDEHALLAKEESQRATISKKFDAIKREQGARITALSATIERYLAVAHLIEGNIKTVEDAILVVTTGLASDLSWDDLADLIVVERENGHPIARAIGRLRLEASQIELILEDEAGPFEVDIRLGGYANANRYYELRKAAMEKLERTRAAFDQAMKSAEAKIKADSRAEGSMRRQLLIPKRKAFWFEKFNWFISSDSYLVISGNDMHQNEFIVKRLMRAGDAYLHADLPGASSVVVRNHRKAAPPASTAAPAGGSPPPTHLPIPHRTLVEAGAFSLCFSKAWEAKIVTSAWWVHASQVSKTAPSGEYLGTGSFMVRGRKNFLPPAQLVLGFSVMFILDEASTSARRTARLEREEAMCADASLDQSNHLYGAEEEAGEQKGSKYGEIVCDAPDAAAAEDAGRDEGDSNTTHKAEAAILASGTGKEGQMTSAVHYVKYEKTVPRADLIPRGTKAKQPDTPEPSPGRKTAVRGKHGKEKRMKKYKHQDDEEREARIRLLASEGKKKVPENAAQPPKATAQPKEKRPPKAPAVPAASLSDALDRLDVKDGPVEGEEDNSVGDELAELAVIDSITGSLSAGQTAVNAMVVAAPFMVVQHYSYRVKLLPGNLKRGTAAKTAISLLLSENRSTITAGHRSLIRSIPESELNHTMPGRVRIAASGAELTKIKKALKKDKK